LFGGFMKLFFSKKLLQPALAVALASAALLIGCDKGGQPPDGKLNTLGIPKESVGVVHFNWKNAQDSEVGKVIIPNLLKEWAVSEKKHAKFKAETGFDLKEDIASVTLGIWFDGATSGKSGKQSGVIIIRGNFPLDKINAYLRKEEGFNPLNVGNHSFLSGKSNVFGFIDNQTAFFSGNGGEPEEKDKIALVEKILAAFDKNKAYAAPKSLYDLEKSIKKPFFLAHIEVENSPLKRFFDWNFDRKKLFQPTNAQLVAGEDGDKSRLRAIARFDKPEKAVAVNGIAMFGIATAKDKFAKKGPDLGKTLDSIKLRAEDVNFIVEGEQSTDEFLKTLNKVLEDPSLLR
jgi:hypothetical protein